MTHFTEANKNLYDSLHELYRHNGGLPVLIANMHNYADEYRSHEANTDDIQSILGVSGMFMINNKLLHLLAKWYESDPLVGEEPVLEITQPDGSITKLAPGDAQYIHHATIVYNDHDQIEIRDSDSIVTTTEDEATTLIIKSKKQNMGTEVSIKKKLKKNLILQKILRDIRDCHAEEVILDAFNEMYAEYSRSESFSLLEVEEKDNIHYAQHNITRILKSIRAMKYM